MPIRLIETYETGLEEFSDKAPLSQDVTEPLLLTAHDKQGNKIRLEISDPQRDRVRLTTTRYSKDPFEDATLIFADKKTGVRVYKHEESQVVHGAEINTIGPLTRAKGVEVRLERTRPHNSTPTVMK